MSYNYTGFRDSSQLFLQEKILLFTQRINLTTSYLWIEVEASFSIIHIPIPGIRVINRIPTISTYHGNTIHIHQVRIIHTEGNYSLFRRSPLFLVSIMLVIAINGKDLV